MKITLLDAPFGAEVADLDLGWAVAPEDGRAILAAFRDHALLLFRGQTLTVEDQRRLGALLGPLDRRAQVVELTHEGSGRYDPYVTLITNIRADGKPIGTLPDGEIWFHADKSFTAEPFKALLLYALQVPATGGTTRFANQYLAYARLPAPMRRRIADLRVRQVYDFALSNQDFKPDYRAGTTATALAATHPVAIANPETGRPQLFVNRLMSAFIEDLAQAEGDALLETLLAASEDPAIVYEHRWRAGDLVLWDNRAVIHARTDFPADQIREMRRITVKGGPLAPAAAALEPAR
ncbi:MAG: TauD/TfdA family dioxygenase [Alphaproteobacteria bacterium]|nr:TauD/TfdA family dioxygenase [Alphaproteobacteria bacterium]